MKFTFRKWINLPRETVFAFFRNPRCLPLLHKKENHIRVLRHGSDVQPGAETWAEVTFLGILPVVVGFRHHLFKPPFTFGEYLIHGPFAQFIHIHEFAQADGGVEIIDHLEIKLPWYFGGELAVKLLVAPGINRSFALRHRELSELAANGELTRQASRNLELLEAV